MPQEQERTVETEQRGYFCRQHVQACPRIARRFANALLTAHIGGRAALSACVCLSGRPIAVIGDDRQKPVWVILASLTLFWPWSDRRRAIGTNAVGELSV